MSYKGQSHIVSVIYFIQDIAGENGVILGDYYPKVRLLGFVTEICSINKTLYLLFRPACTTKMCEIQPMCRYNSTAF